MPKRLRYQGISYRAHRPQWAWPADSGEGAHRYGGRFNPAGIAALYTSLDFKTAWLEAQQGFLLKVQPLTLCAYEVDCLDILDLTDPLVLLSLKVESRELQCPWEAQIEAGQTPPTHELARRLISEGVAGIIVPSFVPGIDADARNLVFWQWHRRRPHRVRLIDDENRLDPAKRRSATY